MPVRDSNLQPFDYESNSVTIRPRLPQGHDAHQDFIYITLPQKKLVIVRIQIIMNWTCSHYSNYNNNKK